MKLDIPVDDGRNMTPRMLLVLQKERLVEDCLVWEEVASPVNFVPMWDHAVRLRKEDLGALCATEDGLRERPCRR